MENKMSAYLLLVLANFMTPCILGQQAISPCPTVLSYEPPGTEPGRWYGNLLLSTDVKLHGIFVDIVLDRKADLVGNWFGDVTTADNMEFMLENRKKVLDPGPPLSIRIFVQYNTLEKIPRINTIRLNGREVCSAITIVTPVVYDRPHTSRPAAQGNARPIQEQPVYTRPTQTQTYDISNVKPYSVDATSDSQNLGGETEVYRPRPGSNSDSSRPSKPAGSNRPQDTGHDGQSGTQNSATQTGDVDVERPRPISSRPVVRPQVVQESPAVYDFDDFSSVGSSTNNKPSSSAGGDNTGQSNDYFEGDLSPNRRPARPKPIPSVPSSSSRVECGTVVSNAQPLIVGGQVTTPGQWPWHVAIYQTQTVDSKYICGGSLISQRHVITAAHCVVRKASRRIVNKSTLTIYLGKHNLRISNEHVQIMLVKEIFLHPSYNASSYVNDLAVLGLRNDVTISQYVRPVCLWPRELVDLENVIEKRGSVVGWGFDEYGTVTEDLMLAVMPVVKQETCLWSFSEFFARFTSENTYCAGFLNGTSVCNGDSGGGMVFPIKPARSNTPSWYLRGLVSLSVARQTESRCDHSRYAIFTDLAKYLEWIEAVISGNVNADED